mmetsp:Transcript_1500/g.3603  ORF Transcript_1500/g.3603 Transcript_1500/m.3603 type:complete len:267 (-) Transcript_1500:377-1177(-)
MVGVANPCGEAARGTVPPALDLDGICADLEDELGDDVAVDAREPCDVLDLWQRHDVALQRIHHRVGLLPVLGPAPLPHLLGGAPAQQEADDGRVSLLAARGHGPEQVALPLVPAPHTELRASRTHAHLLTRSAACEGGPLKLDLHPALALARLEDLDKCHGIGNARRFHNVPTRDRALVGAGGVDSRAHDLAIDVVEEDAKGAVLPRAQLPIQRLRRACRRRREAEAAYALGCWLEDDRERRPDREEAVSLLDVRGGEEAKTPALP